MKASIRDCALVLAAFGCFSVSVLAFGAASPDFEHLRHPVALLGAEGEPNALAFNLIGYVVPGLLLAWQAWRWRASRSLAGLGFRVGLQLLSLSALAFVAQGLLPLDPSNLLAPASRLHALAWSAWWVSLLSGALLVAIGLGRGAGPASLLVLAMLVVVLVVSAGSLLPAPLAQRLAFAAWFGWWLVAAVVFSRAATSTPGSSPPARR